MEQELNLRREESGRGSNDVVVTSFDVIKTVVLNRDGTVASESLSSEGGAAGSGDALTLTIYPGASTTINLISRVLEEAVVVCEEKFTNATASFAPEINSAGVFTVLQSTNFADPASDGNVVWGYDKHANPLAFAVWDPSINSYTITASGKGCTDYVKDLQNGTFYLNVRHLQPTELIFDFVRNVCPSISYNPQTNTAGLIARNPVFDKTGCSVVYKVEHAPYNAEFGFLQLANSGASGVVSDSDWSQSLFSLTSTTKTADCYQDSLGKYHNILARSIVSQGANVDLVYNSTPSIFTAPYFAGACNTTSFTQSGTYSYSHMYFDNYLMMKIGGTENSFWIPIRKLHWGVDQLDAQCQSSQACGTGLHTPYDNTAWYAGGSILPPNSLDAAWLQSPNLPKWKGIFQKSFDTQLQSKAQNVSENTSDFLFLCPSVGSSYCTSPHDFSSYIWAVNGGAPYDGYQGNTLSPYNLFRTGFKPDSSVAPNIYGKEYWGTWIDAPGEFVYPGWTMKAHLKDGAGQSGTTGWIKYNIRIGDRDSRDQNTAAKRGEFYGKFDDQYYGDNSCFLSYTTTNVGPEGNKQPLFRVYTMTRTGGNTSKCPSNWHSNKGNKNNCDLEHPGWSVLEVHYIIEWPMLTAKDLLGNYQQVYGNDCNRSSGSNLELEPDRFYFRNLLDAKVCYYKDNAFDNQAKVIDGGIGNSELYNSVSWSAGVTTASNEYPLRTQTDLEQFYYNNGYKSIAKIECKNVDGYSSSTPVVAAYCVRQAVDVNKCEVRPDGNIYTHVAVKNVYGWSSKFGKGWLLTHDKADTISSSACRDDSDYGNMQLGEPFSCYDLSSKSITEQKLVYDFSQKELEVMHRAVENVAIATRDEFDSRYKEWVHFCKYHYHWSSSSKICEQGNVFDRLVQMGKEHFDEIKPLLAEKLADQNNFVSSIFYEAVSGRHNEEMVSLQEISEGYAHELISEIGAGQFSESYNVEAFMSGEGTYQALNEITSESLSTVEWVL